MAPAVAYALMKDTLHELSRQHINAKVRPGCPLHIVGTSGMRELPEARQSDIYDAIYASYQADESVDKLPLDRYNLRTLPEDEESYLLTVAANFLDKRIGKDMEPSALQLYGIVDLVREKLDPSSVRLVMDVEQRWRHNVRKKAYRPTPLTQSEFLVHTFANTGTTAIRHQVRTPTSYNLLGTDKMNGTVDETLSALNRTYNPCMFDDGFTTADDSAAPSKPDGRECMALIQSIVDTANSNCTNDMHCVLLSHAQPRPSGPFYALNELYQAASFAHSTLSSSSVRFDFPTPSRYEMEQ
ncbi:hypothetical protein AaE_008486, partial [Aphanomyces astaci]